MDEGIFHYAIVISLKLKGHLKLWKMLIFYNGLSEEQKIN